MSVRIHQKRTPGSGPRRLAERAGPVLVPLTALILGIILAETSLFKMMSLVVSDKISLSLGMRNPSATQLIRLDQAFPRQDFQSLLSKAIPTLMEEYQAAALGIDIDVSEADYGELAKNFAEWSARRPDLASRVVWAVGYLGDDKTPEGADEDSERALCTSCTGGGCRTRFTPRRVFGKGANPENYGISFALTDRYGVVRTAPRFVCHSDTEEPIETFPVRLLGTYCGRYPDRSACQSQPRGQGLMRLHSWSKVDPLDLCAIVSCRSNQLGSPTRTNEDLAGKILLLYSDVRRDDEHPTILGSQKGAAILASLIESELTFGGTPKIPEEALKLVLEAIFAGILFRLFHWPKTKHWAIVPAALIFGAYVLVVPKLALWLPDVRNFVFAVSLCFWIEILLKLAWHSYFPDEAKRSGRGG